MSAVAEGRSIAYSAETAGRAGRVACQVLRSDGTDDGALIFSIVIRNDSDCDVRAVAFIASERGHSGTLVQCNVQRTCDFSTTVELKRPAYRHVPDLHIDVHGDDIGFVLIVPNDTNGDGRAAEPSPYALAAVEPARQFLPPAVIRPTTPAPNAPPRSPLEGRRLEPRSGSRSPAAVPMFVFFLTLLAGAGIVLLRPQIGELRVPLHARAESVIRVGYRATGLGAIAYTVVAPDGTELIAGSLPAGTGSFPVALPRDRTARAYLVRLSMQGILGRDVTEAYVHVPPSIVQAAVVAPAVRMKAAPAAPEIHSLALDRAVLTGGSSVNVYYDVDAASGSVALVDPAAQITYGKAEIDASGHAALSVPAVQTERFLSVVLTVKRGSNVSRSRVAVTAEPQSSPAPQADAPNAAPGAPAANAATLVPAIHAPLTVRSGATFEVTVEGGVAGLNLVLNDVDGNELGRSLLDSNGRSATFNAPAVRNPMTLRLLAIYPQGSGSETIVKTILVTAR